MKLHLALSAGLIVLLAGCTLSFGPTTTGLHVRLGDSASRTLTNLETWDLTGSSDTDSFSSLAHVLGEDVVIDGLAPGDWTFTATGYDASGASILTGTGEKTLEAGEAGAVTLTLGAAHSLNLVLSFPGTTRPSLASSEAPDHVLSIHYDLAGTLTAPTGFDTYAWFKNGAYDSGQTTNVYSWTSYTFTAGQRPRILLVATKDGVADSEDVVLEIGGC